MKILYLEPFYGGSHKDFADGLIRHSRFDITLHTLPARFWKWRMRGASLHFAQTIENPEDFDLLLVSDLMSLSDLKALWGRKCPPALVYFHENQLSYPLSEGEKMDYQFGFTDITTGLAADRLIFNSQSHMNAFFSALPGFIKKMPEYKPHWVIPLLKEKSSVIYPGCHFPSEAPARIIKKDEAGAEKSHPLVIWNHRWEFDKNPETFFSCLYKADEAGEKFEIALLGESFRKIPKEFHMAKEYFGDRIRQFGWAESRREYQQWLSAGDIVISTSNQENFGISMVEAIYHGSRPLLPRRLSYPEIIPESFHSEVLYNSDKELFSRFCELLKETREGKTIPKILRDSMSRYSWENIIKEYDSLFESISQ